MRIITLIFILLLSTNLFAESQQTTGSELIKSEFSLVNHLNEPVTEKDYYGKYALVFFGFSHCPSICPVGLTNLTAGVNLLGSSKDLVVPIFISIDPERDTVERLADFVKLFDPKLVGLTGKPEEIEAVTKSFRAYYGRTKSDSDGNYSFDHSPVIYMIGKNGEYLTHFSSTIGPKEIAVQIKKFIK